MTWSCLDDGQIVFLFLKKIAALEVQMCPPRSWTNDELIPHHKRSQAPSLNWNAINDKNNDNKA